MTDKQESILMAALELFATNGYASTSTSKVAAKAKVSEGLIFRHFQNKEGLLHAILELGTEKLKGFYTNIIFESEAKIILKKFIELVFNIPESEYYFWKLQFKLKWELGIKGTDKMKPILLTLINAFKDLGYENPEMEAHILLQIHEGIATSLLMGQSMDKHKTMQFLLQKYNL